MSDTTREREPVHRPKLERDRECELKRELEHERERSGPALDF